MVRVCVKVDGNRRSPATGSDARATHPIQLSPDKTSHSTCATRGEREFPPSRLCRYRKRTWSTLFGLLFALANTGFAQTAPGTVISNTATANFDNAAGIGRSNDSNSAVVTVVPLRTNSVTEFTRVIPGGTATQMLGPSQCLAGGVATDLGAPTGPDGSTLAIGSAIPIGTTSLYSLNETAFVRVVDRDQNLDPGLIDTVDVVLVEPSAGDRESLRLSETGVDTGIFAGFIPLGSGAPQSDSCRLEAAPNTQIEIQYADAADPNDQSSAQARVNPLDVVFDSTTGELISNVTLTLVDSVTGLPAIVYGNDGVSTFPSTIRSGEVATDGSGLQYSFPAGGFNFPVVPPGDYRLVIEPGANYLAPSVRLAADLASLPGGPFTLSDGSFGRAFSVVAGTPAQFDVPIDPFSGGLFIAKSTQTQTAAPGDFVRYQLRVENTSELTAARSVVIDDQLPVGLVFVEGSLLVNGTAATDVTIGANQLLVGLGNLEPQTAATISYVVEVTGGARGDQAVNVVTARAERGVTSNRAEAAIRLTEDLFRTQTTIVGRVLEANCTDETFADGAGVAGVRVYLENGRYVVSDEGGRFHFENVKPGMHVVQMDDDTIPEYMQLSSCDANLRAASNPRSQFVHARGGALQRADFYLRRKAAPIGRVELSLANEAGATANRVRYRVSLDGVGDFSIRNLAVSVVLPDGVTARSRSVELASGGKAKFSRSGQVAIFRLGERSGSWEETISFEATIKRKTTGELSTKAVATFDTPAKKGNRTPLAETLMVREGAQATSADYVLSLKFHTLSAELNAADRAELDTLIESWQGVQSIELNATGHTDSVRIAARNRHVFADNYALSAARAEAVTDYLSAALAIDGKNIAITGRGPDVPVASNETAEGRQKNRRVELIMNGLRPGKRSFLKVTRPQSEELSTVTGGLVPGPDTVGHTADERPATLDDILSAQKKAVPSPNSLAAGAGWVLPEADFRPAIPSIHLAVKHAPDQKVELLHNGESVSGLNFDGVEVGRLSGVALSSWRAVQIEDGENVFLARILNADGSEAEILARNVRFAGGPIRGELVEESSRLIADGKRRPMIAVRLFDGSGELARTGSVGGFRVDAPYRSSWEVEASRENTLLTIGDREPVYRIEPDGIARIELEPTTDAGEVVVRLQFNNQREQEIRAWLNPEPRDWILVGLANGTVGYNTISNNFVAATEAGIDDDVYEDGRVAFFAKGQIKGEYLLTLAYDTRGDARDPTEFEGVVDPDAFYTLYGDGTESRIEAPSQRKLYVKLERQQFVALFGDFDTGLSVTDLARYQRRYNGVQTAYNGKNFTYTAFAADSAQSFQRDEIRGNGTSGLYRLSSAPIISNSESVQIETRDRFDSSEVIASTTLSRFVDYDIDYLRGTLQFKRPVFSRDDQFNPLIIVASYETLSAGAESRNAGGRAAVKSSDNRLEFGATYVSEGQQNGTGELMATDVRWRVTDSTEIRAEYADTRSEDAPLERRGNGYRVELEHRTGRLDVEAYHGRLDTGYGLGQQSLSEIGLEKSGVNGRWNFTDSTHLQAELVRQENLDTGLKRNLAMTTLNTSVGDFSANLGLTHARDKTVDGDSRETNLATASLSQALADDRFVVRLSGEMPINSEDAVTDFPSRVLTGLDWNLNKSATAFVEHEIASGADIESQMTRLGLRASPWQRAQFDTSIGQETTEFGPRLFANLGAIQGWQINERWSMDIGVDHSNTMLEPAAILFDTERELASGSATEDFASAYVGGVYRTDTWTGNARVELRDSDSGDSKSLIGGLYREPSIGHGLSAGLEVFDTELLGGGGSLTLNLRGGWAFRKADQRWSFLDRADFIITEQEGFLTTENTWKLINNFNANKRLNAGSEVNFQYAVKYVRSRFDNETYSGFTDLMGAEYRRAISQRWDIGVHGSVYHSWRAGVFDYGAGLEAGFNVVENTWVGFGYNVTGFEDQDFSASGYTAQGPYISVSVKADQHTLKQIAGMLRR